MAENRHRNSFRFFTIFFLSMFLIVGCSAKSTSYEQKDSNMKKGTSSPQSGGMITIGAGAEPDTLDVHKSSMSIVSQITSHIGGNLVTINPETKELEPYLAESYTVSSDGKTYTFKIRQGVKFQDGTPLTAKAFKDTFDRILNPDTGATIVASFMGGVTVVTAPDDQTLVIELKEPSAPFLRNLATEGLLQPLSLAAIEKFSDDYGRNPVGVGPWKFKEWVTGQSITFERYDDFKWPQLFYDNQGKAYPDQLSYKFISDPQTMLAALDSGSIDIATTVAPKDIKRYLNNNKFKVLEVERQGLDKFLEMNTEQEILSDVNVRKAINMAINKEVFIQAALSGEGIAAYGPLPSAIFGYDLKIENYGHKYNKDEAIKLLKSSGWKKNSNGVMEKDGKELKLILSSSDADNQAAQMTQAMLKEIGVNLSIQSMESGTLIEKVTQGDYDMSFLGYTYADPDILYLLFHSSQIGGLNHTRVKNSELDALLEKGRTALVDEERKQIYAKIQKIVVDEAYLVPIYEAKGFIIVNKRVYNGKIESANSLYLHDSWVQQ